MPVSVNEIIRKLSPAERKKVEDRAAEINAEEMSLRARFAGRIMPIDAAVADRWGLLAARARREGKSLSTIDGLLAATAVHHDFTVVSRNVSDFANLGVQVANPWEACP